MGEPMYLARGRHVLVDIEEVEAAALNDLDSLERALVSAARSEGVTVLGTLTKAFDPSGVTILLLLAESHVSLHTYPDQGKAFFDAFTCGMDYDPANIFRAFANILRGKYKISHMQRGNAVEMADLAFQ